MKVVSKERSKADTKKKTRRPNYCEGPPSPMGRYAPKPWMKYLTNLTHTYNPSTTPPESNRFLKLYPVNHKTMKIFPWGTGTSVQTIVDGKLNIIIIIIIKRGWQCKAGRERLTHYQSEDPNPTTPTQRKKRKGKQ